MELEEKRELAYRVLSCMARWPNWASIDKRAYSKYLDDQSQRVRLIFAGAYDPPIKDETGEYPNYAKKNFSASCSIRGLDFWERLKNIIEKYDNEFSKVVEDVLAAPENE